ncbi:hypothetical protein Tco_1069710 [Tanacetum coccineum]|uniref:Transposase (Putative), gypsy type n=1 Tax=Tanacetum coccineum TaxID=301880 RepID=A0ABQ5HJB2_9ASTR
MGRDTIQLETAVSTISLEYLLEFTSEYGISEDLHPELPGLEERIVDFPKGKDEMPVKGSYSAEDVAVLDTRRTPIQKQPEALLCIVGLSRRYFLGDDVYPTFLYDDDRGGCFAPNPTKVKTGIRPRAAHEVPLLIATTNRVIVMEDATVASEAATTTEVVQEPRLEKEVVAMGPPVNKRRRKRDKAEAEANSPPKVLRKDHAPACPEQNVSDPKPLSYAKPHPYSQQDIAYAPYYDCRSSRVPATEILVGGVATTEGVTNDSRLDTPEACQDMVALGSQPRLRFKQEVRLLKKAKAQVARRDKRIHERENEIKNLEALLEAEADMKKTAEAKNSEIVKELESLRAQFTDLQVSNDRLSQQVSTLKAQFTGEERIKAAFEEFK